MQRLVAPLDRTRSGRRILVNLSVLHEVFHRLTSRLWAGISETGVAPENPNSDSGVVTRIMARWCAASHRHAAKGHRYQSTRTSSSYSVT